VTIYRPAMADPANRRVGVFPGSFDPLTTAHLAIVDAAIEQCRLDRLDLVLSRSALAKDPHGHSPIEHRVAAIEQVGAERPGVRAATTDQQLIADLAEDYDVCVLGADKWHQLHDLSFYDGSQAARDAALERLPVLAVAPRRGIASPAPSATVVLLEIDPVFHEVSSTAVRAGRHEWRA
jgi:nicotinic acid mononucleotide adenylyltransferase